MYTRNVGTENFFIAKIYNMQICNVNVFLFTAPEFEFQVILRSVFLNFHFCLLTTCISEGLKMEDAVSLVDLQLARQSSLALCA